MNEDDLPVLGGRGRLGLLNPVIRRARDNGPVSRVRTVTGDEAWLVTRHAELKRLLMDSRLGNTHPDPENRSRYLDSVMLDLLVSDLEPVAARRFHLDFRAQLTPHFSAARMSGLRARVGAVVDELLDKVLAEPSPVDLHTALSLPLSYQILCDLIGIADRDEYMAVLHPAGAVGAESDSAGGLYDYLVRLAGRKRKQPGDDLASALCGAGHSDEIVALLLVAVTMSYLVTPHGISAAIGLFAMNPDQHELVAADPGLLPGAVEESLRLSKFGESMVPRYANADIDIAGVTILAGDLVLCDHGSVGFDDRVFRDPERFDVTRNPNPHLVFSHGITYCIGAPLARLEIHEVLARLLPRLPAMRLAIPVGEIQLYGDLGAGQLGGGIAHLPIAWG
ncbi:cytochrome P450 [Nonomuraea sp. NPDC001699]